jgi:hypothetical protein
METPLVASTVNDRGRVNFNQVRTATRVPDRLVLVGIEERIGVHVWAMPFQDVAALAASQHAGYSEHIGPIQVANPPIEFGAGLLIRKEMFAPVVWTTLTTARTNTLNRAAKGALRNVFGL